MGEFLRVGFAQLVEVANDLVVARFQHVIGLEQKRPAAAGRIDDLEVPQDGEAAPPVFGVIGCDTSMRVLIGNSELDGQGREALGNQLFDGVLHDRASQLRRRVVGAELLAFGRLRHRGVLLRLLGVAAEQPRLLELLQFRARPLEQVPQHFKVNLIGES